MADRINYEVNFSAAGAQALWNEFLAGSESAGRALNQALGGRVRKELFIEAKTDDSGIKKLVAGEREVYTELQKIINLQEKANKTQQGSATSLRQQVNEAKQARDGMVKYATSADGVFVKVNKINGAWVAQNARVKDLKRQLDIVEASNVWEKLSAQYNLGGLASTGRQITELVNVFQSVSIVVGQVIGSVNQLFDSLQRVQSIELTFAGIGASGDIGAVFSESNRIALGLGVSLNTVRESFQQLSPVILATGGNIGDVSAVTEALSSRFVTFGLSADKSKRVMNGVVQAFAKGKLMAEELTQQISEADPAFRTDLANAINVTVKELGEMVKAGQVTNDVLLTAIPRMSKAAGLFGKLGSSAIDAAKGFREGGVTVEQFRNQIATIEQLSLENLVNPDTGSLQPLLASLLELRAVVTDVAVAFANSEVFKTFLAILGDVASQVSSVIQIIVKLVSTVASITQPIFAGINAINTLGGQLNGFGVISSLVAGIITTKLVAALVTLAAGGIVSGATAAITGLTTALNFLATGGLLNLVKAIGTSVTTMLGLSAATTAAAGAEAAATTAAGVRSAAVGFLTKQLGLQAAAEALSTSAAGAAAAAQVKTAGGIVITGAAATAATPPVAALATATSGLSAAFLAAIPFIAALAAILGVVAVSYSTYKAATKGAEDITAKFNVSLAKIKDGAAVAKKALEDGASGADEFTSSLNALDKERQKLESEQAFDFTLTGVFNEAIKLVKDLGDSFKNIEITGIVNATKGVGEAIKAEFNKAKAAVNSYNATNDQTGIKAKKVAQDILVSQAAISTALDITRAKRAALLEEEAKNSGATSKETLEKLRALDAEIKKIEALERAQAALRAEARKKGIVIDVALNVKDAASFVGDLQEELKGVKASIILETNPEKRAKLQTELNGLEAQLKYLESDITEVTIEANFKVDERALRDSISLSDATLNNLSAASDYAQSLLGLQTGYLSGAERARQTELDSINERLEKEEELRKKALDSAEKRGASEAEINKLKDLDREADIAGRAEIKTKEEEIKAIAEQKRQIEIQALEAKKAALPAQQAAERQALLLQQQMAALELERLKNAAQRARLEGEARLIQLGGDISEAVDEGDTAKEQRLRDLYNNQLKYNQLLVEEEASLKRSEETMKTINGLQTSALGYKQAAQALDIDSQLAAQNALTAQQQTKTAVEGAATAMGNAKQNAEAFAQASRDAEAYEKSGAAETRRQADAKKDALQAAQNLTDAERLNAEYAGEASAATRTAVGRTGDLETNLGEGADKAKDIADELLGIDGKTINVNVNYVGTPGLWTGGPTVGGQTYRINELGKEGFLSSTGTLSPIDKPRNALWKAPGKGMVIPAHIMSSLDVPTGRVSTGVRPSTVGSGNNGLTKIARAIRAALSQGNKPDSGLQEMAAVQAHQAQQIGKLSRAVSKLADKDWNVNVGVRNTGNTAYLDALNRRM